MQWRERRIVAAILASALALAPVAARAEPTAAEIAAARELFEEGLGLEEKGEWGGALERFRKVAAVKTTPQVRFHLALCLERTGKLVDALVEFERAQSEAKSDPNAQLVANNAQKHVADLKERIPRVVVKVPADAQSVGLTIDDSSVAAALAGTAIPLDPGKHRIVVTAANRLPFSTDVELVERGKPVFVEVAFAQAPAPKAAPPPKPEAPPESKPNALPWIVGGIGVAALAGGGVFYGLRQSTISDLEKACGPDRNQCPEDARSTYDRGKTYTTVGNVLIGVGAVAVATAVVIVIAAPSRPADKSASAVGVTVGGGPRNVGIGVVGRF